MENKCKCGCGEIEFVNTESGTFHIRMKIFNKIAIRLNLDFDFKTFFVCSVCHSEFGEFDPLQIEQVEFIPIKLDGVFEFWSLELFHDLFGVPHKEKKVQKKKKKKYKVKDLFELCQNNALHCSITWQSITDYSIEIYTGYESRYVKKYYSDGDTSRKKAIKKGLRFMKKEYKPVHVEVSPVTN